MLRLLVSFFAVATALHVDKKHAAVKTVASALKTKTGSVASRKHNPLRRTISLANAYAVLSRKKQEPAAEGDAAAPAEAAAAPAEAAAEEPPAGDLPIDEEAYAADWQNEHKNDPYPPESVGKQHNPSYDQTAEKIREELSGHWWWLMWVLIVAVLALGVYAYKSRS